MAIFVEIQEKQITAAIVISDDDCAGGIYPESETVGQAFIESLHIEGLWLQTSLEGLYRGVYAGIGYTYDADLDLFIPPIHEEIEGSLND